MPTHKNSLKQNLSHFIFVFGTGIVFGTYIVGIKYLFNKSLGDQDEPQLANFFHSCSPTAWTQSVIRDSEPWFPSLKNADNSIFFIQMSWG